VHFVDSIELAATPSVTTNDVGYARNLLSPEGLQRETLESVLEVSE
jgi:hypothetical protein